MILIFPALKKFKIVGNTYSIKFAILTLSSVQFGGIWYIRSAVQLLLLSVSKFFITSTEILCPLSNNSPFVPPTARGTLHAGHELDSSR